MFITQTTAPPARAKGSRTSGFVVDPIGTNDIDWVSVGGRRLELLHLPCGDPKRAPLVFLHQGLGSVAMWVHKGTYWPAVLCRTTGRRGLVYSRPGDHGFRPKHDEPSTSGPYRVHRCDTHTLAIVAIRAIEPG